MTNCSRQLTRDVLNKLPQKLLRNGRLFNAVVSLVEWNGKLWTIKDFSSRPWFVRWTVVPYLLHHEVKILQKLPAIPGIASHAFSIDRNAIAIEFLPGKAIGQCTSQEVTPAFLLELEQLLHSMHQHHVVHLDLRGGGNILVDPQGHPAIIDFQSGLSTQWMPHNIRKLLEDMDISGALKKWLKYQPEAMGQRRKDELIRINRWRKLWVFRGYFGLKKK